MRLFRTCPLIVLLLALSFSCRKEDIIIPVPEDSEKSEEVPQQEETPPEDPYKGVIPQETDSLPEVWIDTPGAVGVSWDKTKWTELCTIEIKATVSGETKSVFKADSLRLRGRGNTTWWSYPKKPYRFNLTHKANFIGSGETRKWVLLANWMDRTLLRNHVAFEAARLTSLEWTPSGIFTELYLDGKHLGNYWLGEKINVEKGNFLADYLLEFDTSDGTGGDFQSSRGVSFYSSNGGLPINVKYPDLDSVKDPEATVQSAKKALKAIEDAIYSSTWKDAIDIDSFADWFLVYELTMNGEPGHPKSCYMYIRDGKLYAGPVWDFDWGTYPASNSGRMKSFVNASYLYYKRLLSIPEFKTRLKERWRSLRNQFATLPGFIDREAAKIEESEAVNHLMWDCYPNPSGDENGFVNYDENLSFQDAVTTLKGSIAARINSLNSLINNL